MKSVLYFTSWYGIYNALMYIWQWFEIMELGYVIITKVDTVICLAFSIIVFTIMCAVIDSKGGV